MTLIGKESVWTNCTCLKVYALRNVIQIMNQSLMSIEVCIFLILRIMENQMLLMKLILILSSINTYIRKQTIIGTARYLRAK
jgi:hypothetical protein